MAYYGTYQVYKIESAELVDRVGDWSKLNTSINNAGAQAEAAAKGHADTLDTNNRAAWAAADTDKLAEAKAYTDTASGNSAATYMRLTRGLLPDGTDLNTLYNTADAGAWGLATTSAYPNAPAGGLASTAVLAVGRGAGNAVFQEIIAGNVRQWREAIDPAAGTWSAWEQVETVSAAATKNATQDGRIGAVEAKQPVKCVRLEAGAWVWDITAAATHYVIQDVGGSLVVRATASPAPASTPALNW